MPRSGLADRAPHIMSKLVSNWTLREFAVTLFRRKWLLLGPLVVISLGALALAIFLPDRYQSRMKILVKNTRADAVITPEANSPTSGNGGNRAAASARSRWLSLRRV